MSAFEIYRGRDGEISPEEKDMRADVAWQNALCKTQDCNFSQLKPFTRYKCSAFTLRDLRRASHKCTASRREEGLPIYAFS